MHVAMVSKSEEFGTSSAHATCQHSPQFAPTNVELEDCYGDSYDADLEGRKYVCTKCGQDCFYLISHNPNTTIATFPSNDGDGVTLELFRAFLKRHSSKQRFANDVGRVWTIDDMEARHLARLQTCLWSEPIQSATHTREAVEHVSVQDSLLVDIVDLIVRCLSQAHLVFVIHDRCFQSCSSPFCIAKNTGFKSVRYARQALVLEPLLDIATLTATTGWGEIDESCFVFSRNSDKYDSMGFDLKVLLQQNSLVFCPDCLHLLWRLRIRAALVQDRLAQGEASAQAPLEQIQHREKNNMQYFNESQDDTCNDASQTLGGGGLAHTNPDQDSEELPQLDGLGETQCLGSSPSAKQDQNRAQTMPEHHDSLKMATIPLSSSGDEESYPGATYSPEGRPGDQMRSTSSHKFRASPLNPDSIHALSSQLQSMDLHPEPSPVAMLPTLGQPAHSVRAEVAEVHKHQDPLQKLQSGSTWKAVNHEAPLQALGDTVEIMTLDEGFWALQDFYVPSPIKGTFDSPPASEFYSGYDCVRLTDSPRSVLCDGAEMQIPYFVDGGSIVPPRELITQQGRRSMLKPRLPRPEQIQRAAERAGARAGARAFVSPVHSTLRASPYRRQMYEPATDNPDSVTLRPAANHVRDKSSSHPPQQPTTAPWHRKFSASDDPPEVWCMCRLPDDGKKMMRCTKQDCPVTWLHYACLNKSEKLKSRSTRWICPVCEDIRTLWASEKMLDVQRSSLDPALPEDKDNLVKQCSTIKAVTDTPMESGEALKMSAWKEKIFAAIETYGKEVVHDPYGMTALQVVGTGERSLYTRQPNGDIGNDATAEDDEHLTIYGEDPGDDNMEEYDQPDESEHVRDFEEPEL